MEISLRAFRLTNPEASLLLVVDEDIPEFSSVEFTWVNVIRNRYVRQIGAFLRIFARTATGEAHFEFQADRFVYTQSPHF